MDGPSEGVIFSGSWNEGFYHGEGVSVSIINSVMIRTLSLGLNNTEVIKGDDVCSSRHLVLKPKDEVGGILDAKINTVKECKEENQKEGVEEGKSSSSSVSSYSTSSSLSSLSCLPTHHSCHIAHYEGTFSFGVRNGPGKLTITAVDKKGKNESSPTVYSGIWRLNIPVTNDEWTIHYPDGSIYKGKAGITNNNNKEDLTLNTTPSPPYPHPVTGISGFGATRLSIDNQTIGLPPFDAKDVDFLPPKPNGFGTLLYLTGNKYVGEFKDGIPLNTETDS